MYEIDDIYLSKINNIIYIYMAHFLKSINCNNIRYKCVIYFVRRILLL